MKNLWNKNIFWNLKWSEYTGSSYLRGSIAPGSPIMSKSSNNSNSIAKARPVETVTPLPVFCYVEESLARCSKATRQHIPFLRAASFGAFVNVSGDELNLHIQKFANENDIPVVRHSFHNLSADHIFCFVVPIAYNMLPPFILQQLLPSLYIYINIYLSYSFSSHYYLYSTMSSVAGIRRWLGTSLFLRSLWSLL